MNETTPTTPVTVEVTQEDIDAGIPGRCWDCPIAYAVTRHLKEGWNARVKSGAVGIVEPGMWGSKEMLRMPGIAWEFMRDFDSNEFIGERVKPFTFTLDLPTAALRDSAPAQEKPKS